MLPFSFKIFPIVDNKGMERQGREKKRRELVYPMFGLIHGNRMDSFVCLVNCGWFRKKCKDLLHSSHPNSVNFRRKEKWDFNDVFTLILSIIIIKPNMGNIFICIPMFSIFSRSLFKLRKIEPSLSPPFLFLHILPLKHALKEWLTNSIRTQIKYYIASICHIVFDRF